MTEIKGKGFTVKDKRTFDEAGQSRQPAHDSETKSGPADSQVSPEEKAETRADQTAQEQARPLPINFSSFVLSLSSSALLHFGEIPDPITNKKQRNILMAKQTIDILNILKEKTTGNLTKEEEALLDNLLYDLRLRYVKESAKDQTAKQA